jgi:phage anti-repressor protein
LQWFKDALGEQMATLEARLFRDIREREKRARDHILPWLEQHNQAIRDLLVESQRFHKAMLVLDEHSSETDGVIEQVQHEVEDVKALAGKAVEDLQLELRKRGQDIVARTHDQFDHRMGAIELQQEELNRQFTAIQVRLALGEEVLDAPLQEPPVVLADAGDPASIFPADGLLQGFMGEVGGKSCPVVDARELQGLLGSKDKFAGWITDQVARARLKENKHFGVFRNFPKNSPKGGRPRIDYHLTLQGAMHIAMISNTEKGFEVRDYFIECEERYRALRAGVATAPTVPSASDAAPAKPAPPPVPFELRATAADALFMACVRLVVPPSATPCGMGSRRNDSQARRYAKVLAFVLRAVPRYLEVWPFTAFHLGQRIGVTASDVTAALRDFETRGFLTLTYIGRLGYPGPTFELRMQWANLFASAREIGIDLETLATPGEIGAN